MDDGTKFVWIIVLFFLLLFTSAFLLFALLRGENRHVLWHKLVANLILKQVLFVLCVYPMEMQHLSLNKISRAYCALGVHILLLAAILIEPWQVFMLSAERMLYIKDPVAHAQSAGINRPRAIAMLIFPWIVGIGIAVTFIPAYQTQFVTGSVCYIRMLTYGSLAGILNAVVVYMVYSINAFSAVGVIAMWCYYKRKRAQYADPSIATEKQVTVTRRNSMIYVFVLNFVPVLCFSVEIALMHYTSDNIESRHVMLNLFPHEAFILVIIPLFVQYIFWFTLLPPVKKTVVQMFWKCCCCKSLKERHTSSESGNMAARENEIALVT